MPRASLALTLGDFESGAALSSVVLLHEEAVQLRRTLQVLQSRLEGVHSEDAQSTEKQARETLKIREKQERPNWRSLDLIFDVDLK
jgi:hypothetical protein